MDVMHGALLLVALLFVSAAAFGTTGDPGEGGQHTPVTVDARKQLFLDDVLLASRANVQRVTQQAAKYAGNPVLAPTAPWEAGFAMSGSVAKERGVYKAWYSTWDGVAYAESTDGIRWRKPLLDIIRVGGRKTNLLYHKKDPSVPMPTFEALFGVMRDSQDPNPERRYKMGFLSIQSPYTGRDEDPFHRGQRRGLGVATSSDGIHWTLANAFATDAICDGGTNWMWDDASRKWVLYGRTNKTPADTEAAWSKFPWYRRWHWGRAVARLESQDFLHWDYTKPASAPVVLVPDLQDEPGTEIYAVRVFRYESVYIALVQRLLARPDAATLDYTLAVSHDSVHFTRVEDRAPFIALGGVGSWDRFLHTMTSNGPISEGEDLRFYFDGRSYRHEPYDGKDTEKMSSAIGFATIRRDRFVALQASFDGGEFTTRPLLLRHRALHVNAKCDYGEITVEALGPDGQPVARSSPIRADGLDIPVVWETGGLPDGRPVSLRFHLKNAQVFALWSPDVRS